MMQPGTYYIGDLCYVMRDEWDEFCKLTISGHAVLDGEFALADGRQFATFRTSYGDGVYQAYANNVLLGECCVDSGIIGCIRVEDISNLDTVGELSEYGVVVDIDRTFEPGSEHGVIYFNNVSIDTVDSDTDYDDDGYDYDSESA